MIERPNIVVISQARMTSTRLPGKVLKEAGGKSLLKYHVDRLQSPLWNLLIATTQNESDNPIISWCEENAIRTFRGSEPDVLERFYMAALLFKADIIVRVTSDCPFIDRALIEQGLELFVRTSEPGLYISNCFPRTYARGFDFEIFSFDALEEAHQNATDPFEREHVTPYIWNNKSKKIRLENIAQKQDCSDLRLCVDTPEDFELIKLLIEQFHCESMTQVEIEKTMRNHPELQKINSHIEQKKS